MNAKDTDQSNSDRRYASPQKTSALAIVYHYYEKDPCYRDNLIFFLATAVDEISDYFIIISGDCSLDLPEIANVTYIWTKNWNNDFGGYCTFVNQYLIRPYHAFIFVNSSVRGPFLPAYENRSWTEIFLKPLTDKVHLVGASMNTPKHRNPQSDTAVTRENRISVANPHVQTTAYAMSAEAMLHLREIGFYSVTAKLSKEEVITIYEIGLSDAIFQNGWEIVDLLSSNEKLDALREANGHSNFSSRNGDPLFASAYYGRTLSPTEALFVKVNRNMISQCDLASYTFSSLLRLQEKLKKIPEAQKLLTKSYETAKILSRPNAIKPLGSKINRWMRRRPSN